MTARRSINQINPLDIEYRNLPESIKILYTAKEYAWLTREGRERLIERETMPEYYED